MIAKPASGGDQGPAVLVTGGAGYIGSHVALALIAAGFRPVILDDLSKGVRAAAPAEAPLHVCDVGDRGELRAIIEGYDVAAVMHFAGSIVAPESVAEPARYYRNNTANALTLASTCQELGIGRFIFSSTAAVYGGGADAPVTEDAPVSPASPYGWSKLMTEQMLADIARADARFRPICLRYFNVAGADPGGRAGQRGPATSNLIRTAIDVALGRQPLLEIFGDDYPTRDGTCERDFIHVTDLADAHVLALRHLIEGGEPAMLNCGYGRGYTVREVVGRLGAIIGRPLPVRMAPRRAGDIARSIADPTRLRDQLGWRPAHDDLDEILRTALAWEAKMQSEQSES